MQLSLAHHQARLCCLTIVIATASGCRTTNVPARPAGYVAPVSGDAVVVAPLADDGSDQIVSWVDGKAITDWAAEITLFVIAMVQFAPG